VTSSALAGIADDFQRDAEDQLFIAVEENRERVAQSRLEAGHELLIGQPL